MKWIPFALALIGAVAGVYTAIGARAQGSLEAYRREWQQDMATARLEAEAERRPVLWGQPAHCESLHRYERVIRPSERWAVPLPLYERVVEAAGRRPVPEAQGLLQEHRLALQELAEGTRCTRTGRHPGLESINLPQGRLRLLGALLVLDGDAQPANDADVAAGRYLAAVRMGSDVADMSFGAMGLTGGEVMNAGLARLARMAGSPAARNAKLRASLRQATTSIAQLLPGSAAALDRDRLALKEGILSYPCHITSLLPPLLAGVRTGDTTGYFAFAPHSVFCSRALDAIDSTFRVAHSSDARTVRQELTLKLRQGAAAPWNPVLLQIAPNYLAALRQADQVEELFQQTRALLNGG